jgi:anti-sigma regulatory factor (Ser/Thr protein kinase)
MERLSFCLESQFKSVEMVRKRIRGVLLARFGNAAQSCINDFCQVVSELVNNGVEHGGCSRIEGELTIGAEDAAFTLVTTGVRFDPTSVSATMPDFDQHDELPEGGYGLAIIRQLSDTFTYKYLDGRNMTTVSKILIRKDD